jgi:hypothetical protein
VNRQQMGEKSSRARAILERHGRTIITAEVATLVQLASVGADPVIRTVFAVAGALAIAIVGIFESESRHKRDTAATTAALEERRTAEQRARARIAEAARVFREELANRMPLGGTSVPDGTPRERLVGMAQQLREGRFTFLRGRRWSDWAALGSALITGRQEIVAAAGLTAGRLPEPEEQGIRALSALLQTAARHASAVASQYAGYDVTEEPKLPRYMPEDRDVDVTEMDEYKTFATEFTEILAEFDRIASLQ